MLNIGGLLGGILGGGTGSGTGTGSSGGTGADGLPLVGGLLGTLTGAVGGILDSSGGGTTDGVVNAVTGIVSGSGEGGLLDNLFTNALLGDTLDKAIGIGLLGDDGVVSLNLGGTKIGVLPENGGLVSVGGDGALGGSGGLLDIGGLLGTGGLLNLTGLLSGTNLDLSGILSPVLHLITNNTVDPDDYKDPDGNIDPSKFAVQKIGTDHADNFSLTEKASTYVDGRAGIDVVDMGRSTDKMSVTVGSDAVMFTDDKSLYYFTNVERVKFFEGTLYLDTGAGENGGIAYRLYQATFDRTPDNGGLKFWVDSLDHGMSAVTAAAGFAGSAEFKQTYGNLDNNGFVNQMYENVLGRAGEAAGVTYWNSFLASGHTRADVLLSFSESSENVELVGQSIDHGFTVA